MKIGVMTDIHNNLPALNAVLRAFEERGCEEILCCGDLIGIGPYPEETLRRLIDLPALTSVCGNHDRYLTEGLDGEPMDREEMLHHRWEHSRLSAPSISFLKLLPRRADLTRDGHTISIMHYCMNAAQRYVNFTPTPSGDDLARMFASEESEIILYGHDHQRSIVRHDGRWYINPGSLGCPAQDRNIARACVLTLSGNDVQIEPLEITYDAESVVHEIDRLVYPASADIKKYFYGIS